jgi:hypothetical protein
MPRIVLIVAIAVIEIVLNGVWVRFNFSFTTQHQVGMATPSCATALGPLTFCTLRAEQAQTTTSRKLFKTISPEADGDSFVTLIFDSGARAICFSALYTSASASRRYPVVQNLTFLPLAAGT